MSDNGHVRCKVGIVVWRMYGNRELGGEPGSLLLYIIVVVGHLLWRQGRTKFEKIIKKIFLSGNN